MSSGREFRVFLSHAHSDQSHARRISELLGAAGFQVFDPADELLGGDNWSLEIGRALDASEAMIVLISPAGVRSPEVQREIQYALGSERFQDRLIPVEVEPTKDFPWVLSRLPWIKLKGNLAEAVEQVSKILQASGNPDVHAPSH
jgi:hypothetical protein